MSEERESFRIKQAEFLTSVGPGGAYPPPAAAEIAVVGKSNVGKSSLINSLCNNHKLAKTSQSPGKTRLINFFLLNRSFHLVDLPGYGFAKAPKEQQREWQGLIESYLMSNRVDHLFLLLDIRHTPTQEDRDMFRWMLYYGIPFTLVATKADKLPRSKRQLSANTAAKALGAPPAAIAYSSESGVGREELLKRMGDVIADAWRNTENTQEPT